MGSGFLFKLNVLIRDIFPPAPTFLPKDYPDLTGKVALVTGASAGIGLATTKLLASKNCHVFLGVRSEAKAKGAIEKILKELGNNGGKPIGKLEIVVFDLADLTTIKRGADELISKTDKLNIIIHNAGVMTPPAGSKTKQNYELQLGTNVIGPFLLQKYIDPLFLKPNTTFKRIVWVSSAGHIFSPPGGIRWEDINFRKDQKNVTGAYAQSKACDVLLAAIWAKNHLKEVQDQNIVSVSAHPGLIISELSRNLPRLLIWFFEKISNDTVCGAYAELFGLLSPELTAKNNGAYIVPTGKVGELRDDVKASITNGNGDKLWEYLVKETAIY